MMTWYKDIKTILAGEPESWLAYLHGQQLHNRPLFTQLEPRYTGPFLQVIKFFVQLLRYLKLKPQPALKQATNFFVFADTANQMTALEQTLVSLKKRGETPVVVVDGKAISAGLSLGGVVFQLSPIDVLRASFLFMRRGYGLYLVEKRNHPASVNWYFAKFCSAYMYLAYFYRVLSELKPEFVITSNDHNVPNRSMLAVAHHLGIKTVYMQHASVSRIFPALRVNYAFLDGQCALDIYRQCEQNQPDTLREVPAPKIILSGQKKHIKRPIHKKTRQIGVALNALDAPTAGIEFIKALTALNEDIRLRWHPGQSPRDIAKYEIAFSDNPQIILSDPRKECISDYMDKLGWLIAGNSSIHLEAALAGVMPLYYELTPAEQPDYYGYVKHGLSISVATFEELYSMIERSRDNQSPNTEAVRYYSATYLTEWDGREGELVAETLTNMLSGTELPVDVIALQDETPPNEAPNASLGNDILVAGIQNDKP